MSRLSLAQALIMVDDNRLAVSAGRRIIVIDSIDVVFRAHALAESRGRPVPVRPEHWSNCPTSVSVDVKSGRVTIVGGDKILRTYIEAYIQHIFTTCRRAWWRHLSSLNSSEVRYRAKTPDRKKRRTERYVEALRTAENHAQQTGRECLVAYYGAEPFSSWVHPDGSVTTTVSASSLGDIRVRPSPMELVPNESLWSALHLRAGRRTMS